jgi:HEAT repeat protein
MMCYCWHCYAENDRSSGPCEQFGRPVESPCETTYVEQLVWALRHPLPGRQMMAAQILGDRRERAAVEPLRELVDTGDPYLAAQALRSLVAIVGPEPERPLLEQLARSGPPAVAGVALRALQDSR